MIASNIQTSLSFEWLETERLIVLAFNESYYQHAIEDGELKNRIPQQWQEFVDTISQHIPVLPNRSAWLSYFSALKSKKNKLTGCCRYKSAPKGDVIELTIEITTDDSDLSIELIRAVVKHALSFREINYIVTETPAGSTVLATALAKCGFIKSAEHVVKNQIMWQWKFQRIKCSVINPHLDL